jgi:predicted ArsR family transcriptional regulator
MTDGRIERGDRNRDRVLALIELQPMTVKEARRHLRLAESVIQCHINTLEEAGCVRKAAILDLPYTRGPKPVIWTAAEADYPPPAKIKHPPLSLAGILGA